MKFIFALLLWGFYLLPTLCLAQGELDQQETVFYNDEKTWSAIVGTAGWGVNYRQGRRINAFKKRLWAIDMVGLNHPKELSLQNPWSPTTFFVYGKLNSLVNFRASYGMQKQLFRKVDKGGVYVNWFYLGGVSLVWLKPIYYEIYDQRQTDTQERKFDLDSFPNTDFILGRASYFKGFSESTFVPGLFATTGLSFDYSRNNKRIFAIEVGASVDVFAKKLELLAGEDNPMFFFQLYAGIRFGKIVDRMKVRLKKTRKEMEKKRK